MAKIETYKCDIHNCENEAVHKNKALQVIFITDQTEGRGCAPYLSNQTLDLCDKHFTKLLDDKKYIVAAGAQGHNTYRL